MKIMESQIQSPASRKYFALVQFTATEQNINHYAANVLSNSATLNSKYGI